MRAWLRGGLGAEGGEASACPCPGEVVAAAKGIDIEGFSGGIEMFDGAAFEGGGFPFVQREAAAGDHCLLQGIGMVDVERKGRAQRGEEEKVLATELAIPAVGAYGGHFAKSLRQRSREKSGKCRPNEAGTLVEPGLFEEGAPFFGFVAIGTPGKFADRFAIVVCGAVVQDGGNGCAGVEGGGSAQSGSGQEKTPAEDDAFAAGESGLTFSEADFRIRERDAGKAGERWFAVFEMEGAEGGAWRNGGKTEGMRNPPDGAIASKSGTGGTAAGEDDAIGGQCPAVGRANTGDGAVIGQDFRDFAAGFDLRTGFLRGFQESVAYGSGPFRLRIPAAVGFFLACNADIGEPIYLCLRGKGLQGGTHEPSGCIGIEGFGNVVGRTRMAKIAAASTGCQNFTAGIGKFFEEMCAVRKCGGGKSGRPASNDDGFHTSVFLFSLSVSVRFAQPGGR